MTTLSRAEYDALGRAIELQLRRGGEHERQLRAMLQNDPWEEVGKFASYSLQTHHLRLRPWQWPPCWCDADDHDAPGEEQKCISRAASIVRRLEACGLSRYEPDPIVALERVEDAHRDAQSAERTTASS